VYNYDKKNCGVVNDGADGSP